MNDLHFKEPVDPDLFAESERVLAEQMQAIEGFEGFGVIQASETHVIIVILGDSTEVLDRIATEVGSPWMDANVVPLLAAPPERHVGPLIAVRGNLMHSRPPRVE